jgi:hypothetical protein
MNSLLCETGRTCIYIYDPLSYSTDKLKVISSMISEILKFSYLETYLTETNCFLIDIKI